MDALDVIVEGYAQAEAEAEEAAAKAKAEAAAKGKAGQEHGDAADDDAMCGNSRYKGSVADTLNPRGLMDGLRMRDFTTDTLWKTVGSVGVKVKVGMHIPTQPCSPCNCCPRWPRCPTLFAPT